MEGPGPLLPQHLFDAVQHADTCPMALQLPQGAGVQVAEVHAGHQPLVQGAQLQHLVQIPQLVDLAHGLRAECDMAVARLVAGGEHRPQGEDGDVLGLPSGALHQGAGVDDHPGGPHPVRRFTGGGDIADGLAQAVRIRVGQIDEVGSVEGQADARLPGRRADFAGGVLLYVDPLAALILIGVQAQLRQPAGGVRRGLIGEGVGVARRAEDCAHKGFDLRFPRMRKGHSAA